MRSTLQKAFDLAQDHRLAKVSAAVGYRPQGQKFGATYANVYARQAQRHLKLYGETQKRVNQLSVRTLTKPHVTPTTATGATPAGFGGSGYSGTPSANLGAPPVPGNVSLAPPPAV